MRAKDIYGGANIKGGINDPHLVGLGMASVAQKRILRDIDIVCSRAAESLAAQGIYYIADDTNIHKGTALLVGRSGTPYYGGFYFFSIEFPYDYPFSPIKVQSLTQDGQTRFNPNMYVNGKVCLSILNTWHDGPQWSGIQTLESVLLVIMSDVLNANPIQNEPVYRDMKVSEPLAAGYIRTLFQANIRTAVVGMLTCPPKFAEPFKEIMNEEYKKNAADLIAEAERHTTWDSLIESVPMFNMNTCYSFRSCVQALPKIDHVQKLLTETSSKVNTICPH